MNVPPNCKLHEVQCVNFQLLPRQSINRQLAGLQLSALHHSCFNCNFRIFNASPTVNFTPEIKHVFTFSGFSAVFMLDAHVYAANDGEVCATESPDFVVRNGDCVREGSNRLIISITWKHTSAFPHKYCTNQIGI